MKTTPMQGLTLAILFLVLPASAVCGLAGESQSDPERFIRSLSPFDESVAVQALYELSQRGIGPMSTALVEALEGGTPAVKRASQRFVEEWRATERARIR